METFTSTIQDRRPPNDPADFIANRVEFPGVTEVQYNAEMDQMQVGARASDYGAIVESVPTYHTARIISLI